MRSVIVICAAPVVAAMACGRVGFEAVPEHAADGSGAVEGFCAGTPPGYTICSDFDEGLPVATGWTRADQTVGGAVMIADTVQSAPAAIVASFGGLGSGVISSADLAYVSTATVSAIRLEDDFLIPRRPAEWRYEIDILQIDVAGVGSFYNDLTIDSTGADTYRQELMAPAQPFMEHTVPIATLAANAWHHKVLTLDLAAKTYSLEIDGAVATAGACYFPSIGPGAAIVSAGLAYASGPAIGESMYVDNIVLTAQ